jgi:hypothetical protein
MVHPTCGPTQADDIPGIVRFRTYEVTDIHTHTHTHTHEAGVVLAARSACPRHTRGHTYANTLPTHPSCLPPCPPAASFLPSHAHT